MGADSDAMTLGVEEELFLVDPVSRDLLRDPDPGIIADCQRRTSPHKVVPEFLRAQLETNSRVCNSVAEVRQALLETRALVIDAAASHGAAVMAASTHPFAAWDTQLTTPKERYERFAISFQDSLRRFVAGGMHVHAGFGDADTRIRVMTAIRRYLPLLHALSTSSPFFVGRQTGFKSQRMNLFRRTAPHRAAAGRYGPKPNTRVLCTNTSAWRSSRIPARSGGTSAHPRPIPPWRCASATPARVSMTR